MKLTIDQCYFHYTGRAAAFDHILPDRRLRFSTYSRMRDPLEHLDWRIGGAWFPDPADPHAGERNFAGFAEAVHQIKDMARLLAMTVDAPGATEEREFTRGWPRARMWEFYAEQHAGVCLVFDRDRLEESIVGSVNDQSGVSPYHRNVDYTESGMADLTVDVASTDLGTREGAARYVEEHKDELFFLKTFDWKTEYEYRFVTTTHVVGDLYADFGGALIAVIAGERFPDDERVAAIEAVRAAGAEPLEVDWTMHRPIPIPMQVEPQADDYERRRTVLRAEESARGED
jgi:hypothetical protein